MIIQTMTAVTTAAMLAQAPAPIGVVPFEMAGRTIFVRIEVQSKPLWFVLDTGDKYAVIDLAMAQTLGLPMGDSVPIGGGGTHTVTARLLTSSAFDMVGLPGFRQPLFIAAPLTDLARASGHEFAGVLGFDFIQRFVIRLDYLHRTLTFYDTSAYQYRGPGRILPITFNAAGHPMIRAQIIDGAKPPTDGTFVVDIGSGAALILNTPFVDRWAFLTSRTTTPWLEGHSFGGSIDGLVGRLSGLAIGGMLIRNPVTVFSRTAAGQFAASAWEGNIGAAILEKFTIILDYHRNRIILEPNRNFAEPLEFGRSGMVLMSTDDHYDQFRIEAVADHSPASEAGLRAGDMLVAINGRPARTYTLSEIRSLFQHARHCDLVVQREDEVRRTRLELRRLI